MTAGKLLGIDLGTTFSAIATLDEHGQAVTLPNVEGEMLTPSAILLEEGSAVVGQAARDVALEQPEKVAQIVKRLHGPSEGGIPRRRQRVSARDAFGDPPQETGARRRTPHRPGEEGRHHGAGLLRRHASQGDEGRRPDRRARRRRHPRRADRSRTRLQLSERRHRGTEGDRGADGARLRPRRRHLRRVAGAACRRTDSSRWLSREMSGSAARTGTTASSTSSPPSSSRRTAPTRAATPCRCRRFSKRRSEPSGRSARCSRRR